mgnify:CR=1 FL=1
MSSELHKYIEIALEKKEKKFNAEVLSFPSEKKINKTQSLKSNTRGYWNINDSSNNDQLKAITGICFMFGALLIIGLISNLTTI